MPKLRAQGVGLCHPVGMRSDGGVLPDLVETVVLHRLGLVRSDDLPDLAARWLAAELVDSESVRMLAGHDRNDPWALEKLLAEAMGQRSLPDAQDVAVDWVTSLWRQSGETRWAVSTLARLGESEPEFDLGLFIGLDDEWNGGWGRLEPDLRAEARNELSRLLHSSDGPGGH